MSTIDFGMTAMHAAEMAATDGGVVPVIIVAGYSVGKALAIVGGAALVGAAAGALLAWVD